MYTLAEWQFVAIINPVGNFKTAQRNIQFNVKFINKFIT